MLVTLVANEDKVKDYSRWVRGFIHENPTLLIDEFNKLEDEYIPYPKYKETMQKCYIVEDDYRDNFEGVYVCKLNGSVGLHHITDIKKVKNFDSLLYFSSYGVCDNASQVLDYYETLCNENSSYMQDRKFIILMTPIFKADQPEYWGWRWHKWGKYIGKFNHTHEYLYDEVGIDYVYVFDIVEVEGCNNVKSK